MVWENVTSGSEQLPRMGSVRIGEVRVHRALEAVGYIWRDVEPEVERRLRTERRVLIVGPSMSGKTRLALQLLGRLYADHRLLVPKEERPCTACSRLG